MPSLGQRVRRGTVNDDVKQTTRELECWCETSLEEVFATSLEEV